ncbi:lipopolysaccharide biosynthesis protein wbpB [Helicobacter fennelliae]|uniref:UDP-2-acetamido-2-deoxy-D-glucuronic acid dehydrogenase n=2 Tax=Helicobacter fennelliae TaxID=215 RepID=T1CY75_9HELI|nr:Gfo/Idh/MocA family oxidoreductase [Helicobacter fennelliae]GAD18890.1 UDP-2-acetamido-2-deoxy-D-glucuronic acid dehydrogenase [Helicobacter fennelliae MRY12-0050]SQB98413.1 lipopolysaccharide biosynthesis protein wbpB [Helicobacter fennelliae]STP08528.1 lipopolysaccharide biosynthesis protein wbpB [Helicobacter fennelliae]STQ84340.1 lipopolysaccharide biosynthesis protein wbpB [Helicobacter fennelliae]
MYHFGIIGVGGYIAPRHLQAIKQTNNTLICALDKHDSVGILDSYFPNAYFFTQKEQFVRYIEQYTKSKKTKEAKKALDFISICSPNHLHNVHIKLALNLNAHAICEKPLVLSPSQLEKLESIQSPNKIYTILQLRLHPSVIALKHHITSMLKSNPNQVFDITLSYITARGHWYFSSWKGNQHKSGGIISNIGIHFFDMLSFVFGGFQSSTLHILREDCASGVLELEHARVRWFLSINQNHLPTEAKAHNKRVYRSIQIQNQEFEFSQGFEDLHTQSYKEILAGRGFEAKEAKEAILITYHIRHQAISPFRDDYHPLCKQT